MFTCLLAVCVGLAGDGWSYAKAESKPGVSKTAAVAGSTRVPPSFTGRSIAKFVEHQAPVQPSPAPLPIVAQTDGTWAPDKPAAAVQPAAPPPVKPQPPTTVRCRQCGTKCGCGDVCSCDASEAPVRPEKRWYVLPEDSTIEGYGYVNEEGVLRYDSLRRRAASVTIQKPTTYYAAPTRMPMQVPMSCGRPGRG